MVEGGTLDGRAEGLVDVASQEEIAESKGVQNLLQQLESAGKSDSCRRVGMAVGCELDVVRHGTELLFHRWMC